MMKLLQKKKKKNLGYGNSNEKVCANSMYAVRLKSLLNLKNYRETTPYFLELYRP